MLNKKLCASCIKKHAEELAKKDKEIKYLDILVDSQTFENFGLKAELQEKTSNGNLEMMVLKHDPKYNRRKDISSKLKEESLELQHALKFDAGDSIVDEALDVITVCLNAINQQIKAGADIEFLIKQHQEKLLSRDWEAERVIKFSIGELQGS